MLEATFLRKAVSDLKVILDHTVWLLRLTSIPSQGGTSVGYHADFYELEIQLTLVNEFEAKVDFSRAFWKALKNRQFQSNEISRTLKNKEVKTPPKVIKPLSVSEKSAGKKRLILDLKLDLRHQ